MDTLINKKTLGSRKEVGLWCGMGWDGIGKRIERWSMIFWIVEGIVEEGGRTERGVSRERFDCRAREWTGRKVGRLVM